MALLLLLGAGLASAQSPRMLRVDSVWVDSVRNADSSWYDINGVLQTRLSRDCKVHFFPGGTGTAQCFIAFSIDSGKTWAPSPNPLIVLNNGLNRIFTCGVASSIAVRVLGADRPGVVFRITARQYAPVVAGNPKLTYYAKNLITDSTPGSAAAIPLKLRLANSTGIRGYNAVDKVWWDGKGDGTWDDSTTAMNWTWNTTLPQGPSGVQLPVIAKARDGNGLWSAPETLTVAFCPIFTVTDIPAGTFTMGSSNILDFSADPPHQVTLSKFRMSTTDVTQAIYTQVMGVSPATFTGDVSKPVEIATWFDAVLFCNALSKMANFDTVYTFTGMTGTAGIGCMDLANVAIDYTKRGFRLPTEAEWEYACRAGTATAYYWGDQFDTSYCWYSGNCSSAMPVGTKKPNAWGLSDMSGNVWQWCNDWYGDYPSMAQTNPIGPGSGTIRMFRGGSWRDGEKIQRSAYRNYNFPNNGAGFRCIIR
jgi:formylglycine-generating enzyme